MNEKQCKISYKYLMIVLYISELVFETCMEESYCECNMENINKHRSCFIQFRERQDLNYRDLNSESEAGSCKFQG